MPLNFKPKRAVLLSAVLLFSSMMVPMTSHAQSIEIGQLGAAQAYDAGVIDISNGGLDAALWQGTSAAMAVHLLEKIPLTSSNPVVQDLIEAVVFSAGVPPSGADTRYDQLRLKTVMQLGDQEALTNIATRNPDIARDPIVRADLALAGNDIEGACSIADNIREDRSLPSWAKLRAFCHAERGEMSAAELTTELLQNSGYEDDTFFGLMKVLTQASDELPDARNISDPLLTAMFSKAGGSSLKLDGGDVLDDKTPASTRLDALFKQADDLSDDQIRAGFSQLLLGNDSLAGGSQYDYGSFDLASAKADATPRGMGQLFLLATSGGDVRASAEAMSLVLARAEQGGTFSRFAKLFEPALAVIPPGFQAETNVNIFAKAAIERRDTGTLKGMYAALDESPAKARIALVADALGNGFNLGGLGSAIETRLALEGRDKRRAIRDAFIATAMGARLSGDAGIILEEAGNGIGSAVKAGELLALSSAAEAGSRAETALRAAIILEAAPLDDRSLAAVIKALSVAGLPQFAGRLAAEDFLTDL